MKKTTILKLLMLLTVGVSCTPRSGNEILIEKFPEKIFLKGTSSSILDSILGIAAIYDLEDYFLCYKMKDNKFYTLVDKSDLQNSVDICSRGDGPEEFIAPIYCGQYDLDESQLYLFDRHKTKVSVVNIKKSLEIQATKIDSSFSLHDDILLRDFFFLDTTSYLASEDNELCNYILFTSGKDKSQVKNRIESDFVLPKEINSHTLSQKMSRVNDTSKMLASMYFSFPRIDFYNINTGITKSLFYKKIINTKNMNQHEIDDTYFSCITSNQKYVYVLYEPSNDTSQSILVYDWEGNPIREYCLDKRINYMAVDEDNTQIYGINYEKEENTLIIFGLDQVNQL